MTSEERASIEAMHARLAGTYYDVLGVSRDCDRTAVREAYFEHSKRFHPDVFWRKDLGVYKALVEAIFRELTMAFEVLGNPQRRADYDRRLAVKAAAAMAAADLAARGPGVAHAPAGPGAAGANPPPAPHRPPSGVHDAHAQITPSGTTSIGAVGQAESDVDEGTRRAIAARKFASVSRRPPGHAVTPLPRARPPSDPPPGPPSQPPPAQRSHSTPVPSRPQPVVRSNATPVPTRLHPTPFVPSATPVPKPSPTPVPRPHGAPLSSSMTPPPGAGPVGDPERNNLLASLARQRAEAQLRFRQARVRELEDEAARAVTGGDLNAALSILRNALTMAPEDAGIRGRIERTQEAIAAVNAEQYITQARAAEKAGRWEVAAELWARASVGRPFDSGLLVAAANALREARTDLPRAAELARRATQVSPNSVAAFVCLARVFLDAGRMASARTAAEAAARLDPNGTGVQELLRKVKA